MTAKKRLPKGHRDSIKQRLVKRSDRKPPGEIVVRPYWHIQIQHKGIRRWFNTKTNEKALAERIAKGLEKALLIHAWEEAVQVVFPGQTPRIKSPTVGEYIREARDKTTIKEETLEQYIKKLRTLVSEVMHIHKSPQIAYHAGEAYQKWLKRIESVKLDRLSPEKTRAWKKARIRQADRNPAKEAKARRTINTILRNSKSLFSDKIRKCVNLDLPSPLFFEGVDFEKSGKTHYKSEIQSIEWLITAAKNDLLVDIPEIDPKNLRKSKAAKTAAQSKHEAFKILLLALGAGLRRGEIDTLTWKQLDFQNNTIRVETNAFTQVKTPDSEAEVDVSPPVMDALRSFFKDSDDIFVINSPLSLRMATSYNHYRAYSHFRFLTKWLRDKGIKDQKPIHALRKEFGSDIIRQAGIFAGSSQLRHNNISTTRNAYAAKKERVTVDVGGALGKEQFSVVATGENTG